MFVIPILTSLTFTLCSLLLLLLHPFNCLFSWTTWVSRYHKGKISLDLNEAAASAGPYANNLHLADNITTQKLHHSIFTGRMLF